MNEKALKFKLFFSLSSERRVDYIYDNEKKYPGPANYWSGGDETSNTIMLRHLQILAVLH